jgi:hypothetical protein
MSAPLASSIAAQSGVMQTSISTVTNKSTKIGKDSEQSRHVPSGDDDSDSAGGANASGGAGKAGGGKSVSGGGTVKKRRKATLAQVQQRAVAQTEAKDSKAAGKSQGLTPAMTQAPQTSEARALGVSKATSLLNQGAMLSQASVSYDNYDTAERGRTSNYVASRLGNSAVVV